MGQFADIADKTSKSRDWQLCSCTAATLETLNHLNSPRSEAMPPTRKDRQTRLLWGTVVNIQR